MMKLVIDERVKHRLIGLAVILSIGAIFVPAIMKKSNQRIDGNVNVSIELPSKPAQPNVAIEEKQTMFESAKIAHVKLPEITDEQPQPLPTLAKAEPISQTAEANPRIADVQGFAQDTSNLATQDLIREDQTIAQETPAPTVNTAVVNKIANASSFPSIAKSKVIANIKKPVKSLTKPVKSTVKPVIKAKNTVQGGYAIQLATFSKQSNATALISRLKGKGYKASYKKVKTSNGIVYKVLVGQLKKRDQAQLLQKKLASSVKIKGFIVAVDQG